MNAQSQPLATIDASTQQLAESAQSAVILAKGFKIVERSGFTIAAERLRSIKAVQKQLEEKRTSVTGPLNEALRSINGWFKSPMQYLADAELIYKREMATFSAEEERIARVEAAKAAEKARLEQEELQRRAAKAAEAGKAEKAAELEARAADVVPEKPAFVPAKAKGIGISERWTFHVVDPAKVPREFLVVDEAKIGQLVRAMKGGAQALLGEGVRVYRDDVVRAGSR